MMNDGGAAFPMMVKWMNDPPDRNDPRSYFGVAEANSGMSLRDYFAAKVLQARISKTPIRTHPTEMEKGECITLTAKLCYEMADAMIAERSKAK